MILQAKNLYKNCGEKNVLNDISFRVYEGEILGIYGRKGSGKTTILKSIIGIDSVDEGEIIYESPFVPGSKTIGYLSEEKPLYDTMTVKDQLLLIYGINNGGLGGANKRMSEVMEEFDIEEYKNTMIKHLPRDVRRKVEFITAILHKPALLILDDPFLGVDFSTKNIIKQKLIELNKKGTTVIFASSMFKGIDDICDRLLLIKDGKIIEDGSIEKLKKLYIPDNYMRIKTSENIKPIFEKVGITEEEIEYLDYQFSYKDSDQLFKLNKEIIDSKIKIIEMNKVEKTLEDVFRKEIEA